MIRRLFTESEIKEMAIEAVEGQLPPFPTEDGLYLLHLFMWEGKAYWLWCPRKLFISLETQAMCDEITGETRPIWERIKEAQYKDR